MEAHRWHTASEPSSVGIASVERLRLRDGRRVVLATLDVSHLRAMRLPWARRPSWSPRTADGGPWQPSWGWCPRSTPRGRHPGVGARSAGPRGQSAGVRPGVEVVASPQELQLTGDAAAWVMGGFGAHHGRGRRRGLLFFPKDAPLRRPGATGADGYCASAAVSVCSIFFTSKPSSLARRCSCFSKRARTCSA